MDDIAAELDDDEVVVFVDGPAGFLVVQLFPLDVTTDSVIEEDGPPVRLSLVSLASKDDLSDMSEPPLSLSRSSDEANLRDALGDAGGGRRLQTCTWINSQSRRNRRRLPKRKHHIQSDD